MSADALLAICHHRFAFGVVGLIMAEWAFLRRSPSPDVLPRIAKIDAVYALRRKGCWSSVRRSSGSNGVTMGSDLAK